MSDSAVPTSRPLPLVIVSALAGLVVAGTAALWVHYGTAVFFEMVRSGIAACFG